MVRKRLVTPGNGAWREWFLLLAAACSGACGYIGETQPPLLNIPERVTDLSAVQRGSNIVAQFTVPRLTTEGVAIRQPLTLDFRIGPAGQPFDADAWASGARQIPPGPVVGGVARYIIPAREWQGKEVVAAVRACGRNGKHLGWSGFVVIPVLPPPAVPSALRAEAVAEGVRLTWRGDASSYRVFRRAGNQPEFKVVASVAEPEWLDKDTQYGTVYRYQVQALVKASEDRLAESELSAEDTITPEDRFPPAPPAGLSAVASAVSVELTWERGAETDIAAFRVYRAVNGGKPERIGETTEVPAFSDRKIEAGKTYAYAVSAVDRSGNESRLSETVKVTAQ